MIRNDAGKLSEEAHEKFSEINGFCPSSGPTN